MELLTEDVLAELKNEYHKSKITDPSDVNRSHSGDTSKLDSAEFVDKSFSFVETKIDELLANAKADSIEFLKLLSMKASMCYEKAKICLNKSMFDRCKEYLEKGLEVIKDHSNHAQIHFLYLRMVNYLSYVLSRIGELENARKILESIVNAEMSVQPLVYSTEDLFCNSLVDQTVATSKINKLVLNNMQMLGWIYGKLGLTDQYADMIHKSLQKELSYNDGDPIQWAVRCYRLASLFLAQGKWVNARYHLAAAQMILDPLEMAFNTNTAVLYRVQADLARVWVNYGLQLFDISKKSLVEKAWDGPAPKSHLENVPPEYQFFGMEIPLPNVPAKEIVDVQEARSLFSHTHTWLKRARLYYTLRDFPVQYVNIILELSELYRFFSFYEKDVDAQYTVQRKRYEALETLNNILKEVRPNCYAVVSLEIIREIVEVQMEMMHLNLKKIYSPSTDTIYEEDDLKKRMEVVSEIHTKIENLCTEPSSGAKQEDGQKHEIEEKFVRVPKKPETKTAKADEKPKAETKQPANTSVKERIDEFIQGKAKTETEGEVKRMSSKEVCNVKDEKEDGAKKEDAVKVEKKGEGEGQNKVV